MQRWLLLSAFSPDLEPVDGMKKLQNNKTRFLFVCILSQQVVRSFFFFHSIFIFFSLLLHIFSLPLAFVQQWNSFWLSMAGNWGTKVQDCFDSRRFSHISTQAHWTPSRPAAQLHTSCFKQFNRRAPPARSRPPYGGRQRPNTMTHVLLMAKAAASMKTGTFTQFKSRYEYREGKNELRDIKKTKCFDTMSGEKTRLKKKQLWNTSAPNLLFTLMECNTGRLRTPVFFYYISALIHRL